MSDSTPVKYQRIKLLIHGEADGQDIAVQLDPFNVNDAVEWSSGPSFAQTAGIELVNLPGGSPLAQLNIGPRKVLFKMRSGGGSKPIAFELSIYLAAQKGVKDFYLCVSTDAVVTVQVQIGNGIPLIVNFTRTLFFFPDW